MYLNSPINIIENYISKDTCNFLISCYNETFKENPEGRPGILGGPSDTAGRSHMIGPGKYAFPGYEQNFYKNIATDLTTNIINSMSRTISDFYNDRVDPRVIFFSKMIEGSFIDPHFDNYLNDGQKVYPHGTEKTIIDKIGFKTDYSGLLYLNDSYEGGEINFTQYDIKLKPKPGTFIFFEGNKNTMHGVNKIISGERINLVSFYWSTEYNKKYFEELSNK